MADTAEVLDPEQPQQQPTGAEDILPRMVCSVEEAKHRLVELQRFIDEVLEESKVDDNGNVIREGDYGPPFSGSKKKTLLKAGAEKLAEIYGYSVDPVVVQRIEHWTEKDGGPFFHYEVEARIYSKRTGNQVGKGVGSCNSMEKKYRWRQGQRECPACGSATVFRSKREYGGGWYCHSKAGGCGESFKPNTEGCNQIEAQEVGQVENPDVHDLVNTILKISKKRAYVDGVISVTQSSGLLTGEDGDEERPRGRASRSSQGGGARSQQSQNQQPNGQAQPASNQKPVGEECDATPHKAMIKGRIYWTAGVDGPDLLRIWDLCREFDDGQGKDAAKAVMKEIAGTDSSVNLNKELAEKFSRHMIGLMGGDPDDTINPY